LEGEGNSTKKFLQFLIRSEEKRVYTHFDVHVAMIRREDLFLEVATSLNNLARLYKAQRRYADGESLC